MSQGAHAADARALVERIHATPHRLVYAFAGAGAKSLYWLHDVPGSSRTVLEATDHYHPESLRDALGRAPGGSASGGTAGALAAVSNDRAKVVTHADASPTPTLGVGVAAALATDRMRRGEDRAHVASCDALGTSGVTLKFEKGAWSRHDQETLVSRWALTEIAHASGLMGPIEPAAQAGLTVEPWFHPSDAYAAFLSDPDGVLAADAQGRLLDPAGPLEATAWVSGSFHPMHEGHRLLAARAEAHLGRKVGYELALKNAEKAETNALQGRRRAQQAWGDRPVVLSHAALFHRKAERFPGAVFVVGVDTARRVLDPAFYGSEADMASSLARIQALGCRFLVAGRYAEGSFRTLSDLAVPDAWTALFEALPDFRMDVSSTEVRAGWA
jgi:hypothetical protein